ncbi:MAG: transmembrane 220 family protein [Polyangiales bacterium]
MFVWQLLSVLMSGFLAWAAWMQLNDPDPARWAAFYLAGALVALTSALRRPLPRAAGLLTLVALAWAAAIVPELLGTWRPADLGARMSPERPEVEYGRELGGLLIVAAYCAAAAYAGRRVRAPTSPDVAAR